MSSHSRRSITMTFRIEESTMDLLRTESENREVSINTLVNQILRRYVEWDMYEAKVGMLPIAKPVVSALFGEISKDQIVELAKRVGKNAVHDIALFMKSRMDLPSFLSWFEMRMKSSSIEFSRNRLANGTNTYVMRHDLG